MSSILVGKKQASEDDLNNPLVALKYMIIHAALCFMAFLWSYVCYSSYVVHSVFCAVLFASAVFQGGAKYTKMTTKWYLRAVEKILEES